MVRCRPQGLWACRLAFLNGSFSEMKGGLMEESRFEVEKQGVFVDAHEGAGKGCELEAIRNRLTNLAVKVTQGRDVLSEMYSSI